MISSDTYPITLRGKDGTLRVFRNSGYCWGRINMPDGVEYDVVTKRDYYDYSDESAALAFTRAALKGNLIAPMGWKGA